MKYKKVLSAIVILILIPITSIGFIWIKEWKNPFTIDYNVEQWVAILGAILGYVGTASLGVLAFWQNEKANLLNSKLLDFEIEKKNELILEYAENLVKDINYILLSKFLLARMKDAQLLTNSTILKDAIMAEITLQKSVVDEKHVYLMSKGLVDKDDQLKILFDEKINNIGDIINSNSEYQSLFEELFKIRDVVTALAESRLFIVRIETKLFGDERLNEFNERIKKLNSNLIY